MPREKKPEPQQFVKAFHSRYNGRDYYGQDADDKAELAYRRDLCAWYEKQLAGADAFARSVSESLNSGDGSYRP